LTDDNSQSPQACQIYIFYYDMLLISLAPNYTAEGCIYQPDVIRATTNEFVIGGRLARSPQEPYCKVRLSGSTSVNSYDVTVQFYSVLVSTSNVTGIYLQCFLIYRNVYVLTAYRSKRSRSIY